MAVLHGLQTAIHFQFKLVYDLGHTSVSRMPDTKNTENYDVVDGQELFDGAY